MFIQRVKLRDGRALLGAIGVIIVGLIISSMIYLTFGTDQNLGRARWWWEIMMNLQTLSCALIWFCFVEKVSSKTGAEKIIMQYRMWMALLLVLTPTWITLYAAYENWFINRPELHELNFIVYSITAAWFVSVMVPRMMKYHKSERTFRTFLALCMPRSYAWLVPVLGLVIIGAYSYRSGAVWGYVAAPFLMYFAASIAYLKIAFEFSSEKKHSKPTSISAHQD